MLKYMKAAPLECARWPAKCEETWSAVGPGPSAAPVADSAGFGLSPSSRPVDRGASGAAACRSLGVGFAGRRDPVLAGVFLDFDIPSSLIAGAGPAVSRTPSWP